VKESRILFVRRGVIWSVVCACGASALQFGIGVIRWPASCSLSSFVIDRPHLFEWRSEDTSLMGIVHARRFVPPPVLSANWLISPRSVSPRSYLELPNWSAWVRTEVTGDTVEWEAHAIGWPWRFQSYAILTSSTGAKRVVGGIDLDPVGQSHILPLRISLHGLAMNSIFFGLLGFACGALSAAPAHILRRSRQECGNCGYDRVVIGSRCPECGRKRYG
jgi:hypothetical protein